MEDIEKTPSPEAQMTGGELVELARKMFAEIDAEGYISEDTCDLINRFESEFEAYFEKTSPLVTELEAENKRLRLELAATIREGISAVADAKADTPPQTNTTGEKSLIAAAEAGWNACRRQVYLLSEDYIERAHPLKGTDSTSGNFHRGQYDVAKSFAKAFNAFEALDCDYFNQIDFASLAEPKDETWPGHHSAQKQSSSTPLSESATERAELAMPSSSSLTLSNALTVTDLPTSLTSSSTPKPASSSAQSPQTNVQPAAYTSKNNLDRLREDPIRNSVMWGEPLPHHEDIPLYLHPPAPQDHVDGYAGLEALAKAATQGPHHIYTHARDDNNWTANAAFHDAASPQAVLDLIAKARANLPVQPTTWGIFTKDGRFTNLVGEDEEDAKSTGEEYFTTDFVIRPLYEASPAPQTREVGS